MLYVCASQDQADKHVASIAGLLEQAGVVRRLNKFGSPRAWRRNQLQCDNGFTVEALGLDTAARGIKVDEFRPDLIIFDEAHKLSAYRYGSRAKIDKTKRYMLAEKLGKKTKHLLLMTATPHKGDDENFRLLLSLLDDKVFASLSGMRRALDRDNSPYFLPRMK